MTRSYANLVLVILICSLPVQLLAGHPETSNIATSLLREPGSSEFRFIPPKSLISAHKDKIKHFSVSLFLVTSAGYYLSSYGAYPEKKILRISASFSFGIGVGKEIADGCLPHHDASWGDLLADAFGIFAGGVILHNMP